MQPNQTGRGGKPKFHNTGPSPASIARGVAPVEVIKSLFPQLDVEKEPGSGESYKVRVMEGHLHITKNVICLLEDRQNTRFHGGGGIDAYCICAGMDKKNSDSVKEAIRAILTQFHPQLVDQKAGRREIERRMAQVKIPEKKIEEVKRPPTAELPPRVETPADVRAVRDYLVDERGLNGPLIDDAMKKGAIYAARRDPYLEKMREAAGKKPLPNHNAPLNIIFSLLDNQTNRPVSYAKRGVGGDFKLNVGPKATSCFRVGNFSDRSSAIALTESPIEALSRRSLLEKTDPALASRLLIAGMCGACNPVEILMEAKARGITHVIASFNNDPAGRGYNREAMEAAKALGMTAAQDMPAGEVMVTFAKRAKCEESVKPLIDLLRDTQLPVKEYQMETPGWVCLQFPNTASVCEAIEKIEKQEVGYHVLEGRPHPEVDKARDELVARLKKEEFQHIYTEAPDHSWRLTVANSEAAKVVVKGWHNTQKNTPHAQMDPGLLFHEFKSLVDFDYVSKDWNEVVKGSPGRVFTQDFEPQLNIAKFIGPAKVLPMEATKVLSPAAPSALEPKVPPVELTGQEGPSIAA